MKISSDAILEANHVTAVNESTTARHARLESTPWTDAGTKRGFLSGTISSVAEIWNHRELLGLLTRRELKARYKDSSLGFVWSLIKPLSQLLVYWVVVGSFIGAARNIENFGIFIFAGLAIYLLFSEIVGGATTSIIGNSGLVKKVYLPREIFPLSTVGSALFSFLMQLIILTVAAVIAGTLTFGPHLLYAVGSFVLILIYGSAIGILLSALNVYLRDIQHLVEVVLMLMLWGSPILYNWSFATTKMPPWLAEIYINNPISLAVVGFQEAFWAPASNGMHLELLGTRMGIATLVGIVVLFIAQRVFSRLQGNFAQEL